MKGIRTRSYYQKLVASHLTVLLLTVSIMAVFNYGFSKDQHNRRMLDLVSHSGSQTASGIEARFRQMANVSDTIRYLLQQLFSKANTQTPRPQADADAINDILALRDAFGFKDISAWMPPSFFSANEGMTFFSSTLPNGRFLMPSVQTAPAGKVSWITLSDYQYPFMRFQNYEKYNLISCFMRVSTLTTQDAFCFFIDIDERELAAMLEESEAMPLEQFIVDEDGLILSHPNKDRLGERLPQEDMLALAHAKSDEPVHVGNSLYLRYPLRTAGWALLVSVPQDYLMSLSLTAANGLIPAVCIATLVAALTSLLISRQLNRRLKVMGAVIRSIEPNFSVMGESVELIEARMPVPSHGSSPDVLDELSIVFNKLVDRLNVTMQSALSGSLAQEKLRYQLLRAKINPHFLYNILDSIKICNTLGRIEDANLLLSQLAAFYRLILRKSDLDIITIGEELEIVRLYLEMESVSHEQAFSYSLETDPDVGMFTIPRFVLQPLVENCVIHGLPGDAKQMHITLSLRYVDDIILITIKDDGLGMDEATMSRLMRVVRGEEAPPQIDGSMAFWGLNNVAARLKPYVADPGEPVHYTSVVGEGTTVCVELKQVL